MSSRRSRRPGFYLRYARLGLRLSRFGAGLNGRLRVAGAVALLPLRGAGRGRKPAWTLPLQVGTATWGMRVSDRSQIEAMREVLLDGEYDVDLARAPARILDLGANVGFAALGFRARYPDAHIVCVEADPGTFALLLANVAGDPRITAVHRAMAGADGDIAFHVSEQSASSSMQQRGPGGDTVLVRGSTLEGLLAELGWDRVDLLKIDIEGAEFDVLGRGGLLHRIDALVGEFHYDLAPVGTPDLSDLLPGFRFEVHQPAGAGRLLVKASRARP